MTIGVYAKLTIQEGKNDEFEKAFLEMRTKVLEEPGNIFYELHKSRDNETTYVVLEQYKDQDALDAHSKHLAEIGGALGGLMAGRPEVSYFDAVE